MASVSETWWGLDLKGLIVLQMLLPVEIGDVFVNALKGFVEASEDLQVVLSELLVAILQLLWRESKDRAWVHGMGLGMRLTTALGLSMRARDGSSRG